MSFNLTKFLVGPLRVRDLLPRARSTAALELLFTDEENQTPAE
jgi:hypothetical protein